MDFSRALLKQDAKNRIRNSKPQVLWVGVVYLLLTSVLSTLALRATSSGMTMQNLQQFYTHIENGDMEYALRLYDAMMPSTAGQIIELLLQLVSTIVGAGWVLFLLNTIRNNAPAFGNLLDGFGFFWKLIWLNLVMGFFIALWTLLFIVPGIVAAYRYRLALYLLLDNPNRSALECIRESKRLMNGRKMELFVLDLSFIGWSLLTLFPLVGYLVQIWAVPYMDMSYALYYERIRGLNAGSAYIPPEGGWQA